MANAFEISQIVTKAGLTAFEFLTPFTKTIMDKSKEFGNFSSKAKKTGKTIEVSKPVRLKAEGGIGSLDASFSAQDWVEDSTPLSINGYAKVHLAFPTIDQTLDLTADHKAIIKECGEAMAYSVEEDMIANTINTLPFGVLGGTTGLVFDDATEGLAIMKENGCMLSDKWIIAPQTVHSALTNSNRVTFNPASTVSQQYKDGVVQGTAAGFSWVNSEFVPVFTNGTAFDAGEASAAAAFDGTTGYTVLGAMDGATTDGANTVVIDGVEASTTITAGTIIKIAGVTSVNPRTYSIIGRPRTFCVAADATATGAGVLTLTLTEKIYDGSGVATWQNVSALPADGAVVSYLGKASTSYRQAFAYTKETFMKAFCRLTEPMDNSKFAQQINKDGVICRGYAGYDHEVDENVVRLDSAYGVAGGRLEWGVRYLQEI